MGWHSSQISSIFSWIISNGWRFFFLPILASVVSSRSTQFNGFAAFVKKHFVVIDGVFIFFWQNLFFGGRKILSCYSVCQTKNKYSFKNQKSALVFNLVCKTAFKSMNFTWVEHFSFSQRWQVTLRYLVHNCFPSPFIFCISAAPLSHRWSLNLLRRICCAAALKKPWSILPVSLSQAVMTRYNVLYLPINSPKTLPGYITLCFHSNQFEQYWGGGGWGGGDIRIFNF